MEHNAELIEKAAELIKSSKYAIGFTGAGVSVESGIPPFRGENGLWNTTDPSLLSLSRFYRDPAAPEADGPVTELYRLEDGRRGELETPAEGLATVRYYCGPVMLRLYTEGGTLKNLTLQRTN